MVIVESTTTKASLETTHNEVELKIKACMESLKKDYGLIDNFIEKRPHGNFEILVFNQEEFDTDSECGINTIFEYGIWTNRKLWHYCRMCDATFEQIFPSLALTKPPLENQILLLSVFELEITN